VQGKNLKLLQAAALALMCVQLLVVGYSYALYRKVLAANPAQPTPTR
jgi:hypothetical protein